METRKTIRSSCSLVTADDLKDLELLQFVAPEAIEGILESCSVQDVKKNDILLDLGQTNRHLFMILSGRMRVHLGDVGTDPIAVLERGEAIGEISLIDHMGACAIVVADTDARLLVLEEDLVWSLVQVSHAAACNLLKILTRRLRGSASRIAERIHLEGEIHRYGSVDALSGLHNRYWFDRSLPRFVRRAERTGKTLSLLLLDIDRFKQFNDRHGHLSGDRAIHTLGRILLENLRPGELAARYGGDEFLILLPEVTDKQVRMIAERIRDKVAQTDIQLGDGTRLPPLNISIGLGRLTAGMTPDALLEAADAALYRAKKKGRNRLSD